jgi:uncharacterized membrane protein
MIVHQLLFLAIALFIKANYLIFSTTFSLHSGAYSEGGIAFFVTTITPLWCLVLNYLYLLWMALPYQLGTSVLKQQSV